MNEDLRLPSRLNEDLRLPSRLNEDLRRLAEMDCISLNSAIVRLLAKGVREEVANGR
ncbi:toxin-antitoxin system HicB family antitoxin [Escherichia coli]|nr:toxin-antitoxin system HicB family antitoxin [Escherichia coli]EEY5578186.1 toxin-antitoxin system HicB family antitoxin [Escherichia coli]EGZ3117898.1 toxin-antitoxin system HicB family antitoxin [Escherichia coli]EGZ9107248.1 toxin-antitoxin system HicB family antitoxin [Escherichia coli]EGZ9218769.1 toxin-antitoxin system HicB family antitoxin [Escherichia coli]